MTAPDIIGRGPEGLGIGRIADIQHQQVFLSHDQVLPVQGEIVTPATITRIISGNQSRIIWAPEIDNFDPTSGRGIIIRHAQEREIAGIVHRQSMNGGPTRGLLNS